jgi:hypothetical protein
MNAKKKYEKELRRKEKKLKTKKYNVLMGISMSEKQLWHPHAWQRTGKETVFSIYKKIDTRLRSKQETKKGYVK